MFVDQLLTEIGSTVTCHCNIPLTICHLGFAPQDECPKGVSPRAFFSLTNVDCNKDTCRTFGSIFTNGSDFCENLWDGAFMYEPNEEDAYSIAWNPARTGGINPNSLVNAYVAFPDTCPGAKIDLVCCSPHWCCLALYKCMLYKTQTCCIQNPSSIQYPSSIQNPHCIHQYSHACPPEPVPC